MFTHLQRSGSPTPFKQATLAHILASFAMQAAEENHKDGSKKDALRKEAIATAEKAMAFMELMTPKVTPYQVWIMLDHIIEHMVRVYVPGFMSGELKATSQENLRNFLWLFGHHVEVICNQYFHDNPRKEYVESVPNPDIPNAEGLKMLFDLTDQFNHIISRIQSNARERKG